jgi:hypothetical protein
MFKVEHRKSIALTSNVPLKMIYTCAKSSLSAKGSVNMDHAVWSNRLLEAVEQAGEEGRAAVDFLRARGAKIGFKQARPNVGAFWTPFGNIRLNTQYYSYDTPLNDLRIRTLIIHEARHLQQGILTALSVYGELDAWQLEFRVYHRERGKYPHAAIAELMTLPLGFDRAVLKRAAMLMQDYAGKGYRIDLLPLYPLGREVKYWLTRQ